MKARKIFIVHLFTFNEQLKFHAQMSRAWKMFYNLGARSRGRECSESVFESLTLYREVPGSSQTRGMVLYPWARLYHYSLVLVQAKKTYPHDWKIVDWVIKYLLKKSSQRKTIDILGTKQTNVLHIIYCLLWMTI